MSTEIERRVGAVVVHHRSYETIATSVDALVRCGLNADRILVVDNSEEAARADELSDRVGSGINVLFLPNRGYGAAANAGALALAKKHEQLDYILVATHETIPEPDAVRCLVAALDADESASVAGPLLVTGSSKQIVWSAGGELTRRLRLPRHRRHGRVRETSDSAAEPCEWVDGAFVLYRADELIANPIDETYFMYMEEVDLHQRLRTRGKTILCVPGAVAFQSSGGIPDYYLTRNMQKFQSAHGTVLSRTFSAPYEILRRTVSRLLGGGSHGDTTSMIKGWVAGLRSRGVDPTCVRVVNPVGVMLKHYSLALEEQLMSMGVDCRVASLDEPSRADYGRLSWVGQTYRLVVRSRMERPAAKVLFVWPVLGALDTVLVRLLGGRNAWLVIHDPQPLVRSVGNGRLAWWLANTFGTPNLIVHSEEAKQALLERLNRPARVLDHPIRPIAGAGTATVSPRAEDRRFVIRVFGQYKVDRDIELLEKIATRLQNYCELEIVGVNWPAVDGWTVSDAFISESQVDELLGTADLVLIPYRRFYQSGVAIRCLEVGTFVVGPRRSSLAELFGEQSPLLAASSDPDDWLQSIEYALSADSRVLAGVYRDFADRASSSWLRWCRSEANDD